METIYAAKRKRQLINFREYSGFFRNITKIYNHQNSDKIYIYINDLVIDFSKYQIQLCNRFIVKVSFCETKK